MNDERRSRRRGSSFIVHRSSFRAEAYGSFAYAYDQALGHRFFRAMRRLLRRVIDRYPPRVKTHLDVGCGTAIAVEYFLRLGYRSVGIDLSLPMLQLGRRRARHLLAGDMRALPLRGTYARVTCLYDTLNHLKNSADLTAAFRCVARVLDEDGLFLFDVNHPDIYPAIWGNDEPFVADGRGFHLKMATKFRPRDRIAQAMVTGWAEVAGERVRIHERREQRAYSEREIVDCLAAAGLVPVEVTEFDPYAEARNVKLFFVCRHG
jgi:SAM-dependent methyltransferase